MKSSKPCAPLALDESSEHSGASVALVRRWCGVGEALVRRAR